MPNYCNGELQMALDKVLSNELKVAEAAEMYGIPSRTIYAFKQRYLLTGARNTENADLTEPEAKEDKWEACAKMEQFKAHGDFIRIHKEL